MPARRAVPPRQRRGLPLPSFSSLYSSCGGRSAAALFCSLSPKREIGGETSNRGWSSHFVYTLSPHIPAARGVIAHFLGGRGSTETAIRWGLSALIDSLSSRGDNCWLSSVANRCKCAPLLLDCLSGRGRRSLVVSSSVLFRLKFNTRGFSNTKSFWEDNNSHNNSMTSALQPSAPPAVAFAAVSYQTA